MSIFNRKPVAAPPPKEFSEMITPYGSLTSTGGSGGLANSLYREQIAGTAAQAAGAGGISAAQMSTMNAMRGQAMRQQIDNAALMNNPQKVFQPYPDPPSPQIYFTVRPIKNGFILSLDGDEIFCADIGAVGTRVTTLLAERELKK